MRKLLSAALFVALSVCLAPDAVAQCQLPAPVLHDPANGQEVGFGSVTLRWAEVTGAQVYEVFISIDNGALESHGETPRTTQTLLIDAGRFIQWKVTAKSANCGSSSSPLFSFTTSCPAERPSLLAPARGARFSQGDTVNFAWTAVAGSTGYDVIVTPDFGQTFVTLIENTPARSYSAQLPNGDWGWHVRANFDGQCPPAFSEPSHFQVGASCDNPMPTLISPADGATSTLPVTFSWNPVRGATGYELLALVGRELRLIARTTDTSAVLDHGLAGTFNWFVQAEFPEGCPDTASAQRSITVEAGETCGTGSAQPVSPVNGASNLSSPVKFSWNGVTGAVGYRVVASIGGSELAPLGTTTGTSLEAEVPAGTGFWLVQTFFGDRCPSTVSERFAFTVISGATCEENGPVLVAPANNAANVGSPVTFEWRPVRGAHRYALFVAAAGNDFEYYGTTGGTKLEARVPDGLVRWLVIATSAGCPETRSQVFSFVAGSASTCPTGSIGLLTPQNGATVNSPVTLSWTGLAGVDSYRVTVLVNGETPIVRRTEATQATFELPAGTMKWLVEGLSDDDCRPILSTVGEFTVARATNCAGNAAPSLITPVGTQASPVERTSPVTFSWNPAANAIAYRIWISRNGNAFEDIGVTDKTTVSIPLPGGVYAWYLDAVFRGCDPMTSATAYFVIRDTTARCPAGAPTPLSPAQGSSITAPVTFSWTEVAGADRYRVFLSVDGSEERLIGTTAETTLTRVLPPGVARWRVEAVSDRCAATTSQTIQFTIPQAANCTDDAADLIAPANGASLNDQEVAFAWTPVTGAVRYVIVAKTEDGSPVPIGETAGTTLTRKLPYGRITWSVIAFFAGCEPTQSAAAAFLIAPPQNCPNRSPILLLPSASTPEIYSPVVFAWSRVPNATGYQVWVAEGEGDANIVAATEDNHARVELPPGTYRWFVEAKFANCPSTESATGEFTVKDPVPCGTPEQPSAHVVGQALSGTPYRLRWTPLPNVDLYEVQESTSPAFDNAATIVAEEPVLRFVHEVTGAPVQYLYRVRGISRCNDARGPYSEPAGVFVVAPRTNNASAEVGVEGKVVQTLVLPGSSTPRTFVARVDKPWLTVTPSSGTVGVNPVTLTVTADPSVLVLGTNTGTVTVEYTSPSAGNVAPHAVTTVSSPISVSLVTPVTPTGKGTPPPDALIFPIVGHATGVNDSLFESDIRIANLTPQTMKYQVNFTPSGTDGTQNGSSTTIEVQPNTTIALDDVVASVFGTGTTSSALGMLEVRPLTTATTSTSNLFSSVTSAFPALNTAASSRTYNFTPNGTFGQFIPAIPFSKFVGKGTTLSLLQVSQSSAYRANFGFTEAAGSPVDLMVKVFDTKNSLLATIPVSLGATQHLQINGMLAANGINDLADGRVEVDVVGGDGKVTAYVSEIDNKTNDPLLVNAVPKATTAANRWVVPGMAYINNGFAFWVSDLRIFNAGAASTPATVTFYPQGNGTPVSRQITIDAGEVEVLDNVVSNLFGQPNGAGGAVAITTPSNAQLHATARTYNQTANGTYGQFIPGITVAQSVGNGDRALQILQLESSSRFRTNIGVTETSGNAVRVEIIAIQPDSIVTPVVTYDLAPGEFRQFSLADFFDAGAAVYNARVTVKVIGGAGRVTAYGSAIDAVTQDPTYVPAQ